MDIKTKRAIKTIFDYLAISDKSQKADAIFIATSFFCPSKVSKRGFGCSEFLETQD